MPGGAWGPLPLGALRRLGLRARAAAFSGEALGQGRFGRSGAVPGHELAGLWLPLVDLVELCPDAEAAAGGAGRAEGRAACAGARVALHPCRGPEARVEVRGRGAYAAVRCCWHAEGAGPETA
ncbi:unnamed protein product, partial [Prorocentrum cordatum]